MIPTSIRLAALATGVVSLVGVGALTAPAAMASPQAPNVLVSPSMDISSNGSISTMLSVAGLPQGSYPTASWSLLRTELSSDCSTVDWSGAEVASEGSREDVSNGVNVVPIPAVGRNGCYSLELVLHATFGTSEVRVPAGGPNTTAAVRNFTAETPRGLLGETRLVMRDTTPGMLQETNEIYFAHPSARNVAITPHLIDHSIWRVVEVAPGEFRLINKATGNALQATRETGEAGNRVVTTPSSWDNEYQRWSVTELWSGPQQLILLVNIGTGTMLGPTGTPYLHGDTFGVEVGPGNGWTLTSPIAFSRG